MRLLIVGLGFLLTGCTTVWTRPPGGDVAQFRRDDYECEHGSAVLPAPPNTSNPNVTAGGWTGTYQAGTAPALQNEGQAWFHISQQARMYRLCMESRGYTKQ